MTPLGSAAAALAISALACGMSVSPAAAKLTKLELTSQQSYGTFGPGEYVWWQGQISGELAPTEKIPDLDKAAKNAHGMVEYSAKISLMFPKNPKSGNGTLLVDIPNRGRVYAEALYNSPRDEPFLSGTTEVGTGFLQDHGFAIAEVMWELGQGADLPTFTDNAGQKHFVEGVGFAIVRDAADFLKNATADSAGTANPLRGAIKRALASGKSQSGRYLKTFLYNGFNMAEGRRVFDGMHVFVSGAGMLPIMQSGTGPQSSATGAPDFDHPEFPGVHDGVLTIGEIIKHVRERGEKPPLTVMISSTTDFYSLRASLGRTGGDGGTSDLPIPANVRMYDVAGASHVVNPKAKCDLPPARLDWSPVSRATLLHLNDWVARDINPPANRLMPLEPANGDKSVLRAPANLPKAVIEIPKRDADGNALGGVRLPDQQVPLGVNARQNSPLSFSCMLAGAYVAFPRTQADADARHDSHRPALERYKTRNDYVNEIRIAARSLEHDGFLLPDDAAVIIQSAAENPLWRN
ncbi:MAG TPA: alpha/beta hydrolase domain-containing protein [Bradyrhizobium sp.]